MNPRSLLLIDGDSRGLRVLEVALARQGFTVVTASDSDAALAALAADPPSVIISEIKLAPIDGFELCQRIRANPAWAAIPFVFLTTATAIEDKVRGLALGVDDYLTKPIYIKEVVARLDLIAQKRQHARPRTNSQDPDGATRMVGRLADMRAHELIQTVEVSRKSGVIQLASTSGQQAAIYFRDGRVIDAEAGPLQGEDAVYRLLTWTDGAFEVVMRTVRRRDVISLSTQALLMEGMRRLDEWSRLLEQLPPLDARFDVDPEELLPRLAEIPDEHDGLLKLIDGRRALLEVIDASAVGDLESLQVFARLYFEGVLVESVLPAPAGAGALLDAPPVWQRSERTARLSVPPDNERALPEMAAAGLALDVREPAAVVADSAIADANESPFEGERPPAQVAPTELPPDLAVARTYTGPVATQLGSVALAFRPSGMRLVDEAVAAATLLDDMLPAWMKEAAPASAPPPQPTAAPDDDDEPVIEAEEVAQVDDADEPGTITNAQGQVIPARPESSASIRMRASFGAMRAEVAGEVSGNDAVASSTARELMTIRPRSKQATPEAAPPVTATEPAPAATSDSGPTRARVLPSAPVGGAGPRRIRDTALVPSRPTAAHAPVPTPSSSRGGAPWLIVGGLLVAGVVAVIALGGKCRRAGDRTLPTRMPPAAEIGGATAPGPALDARVAAPTTDAAAVVAPPVVVVIDAAPARVLDSKPGAPGYREYRDSAEAALRELDFEAAIELAEQSLALKRSARAYMIQAQAQRQLGRNDAALETVARATGLAGNYGPAWLLRGDLLWELGRKDEARRAYVRFLELEPRSRDTSRVMSRVAN